jgi:hypothetical protein
MNSEIYRESVATPFDEQAVADSCHGGIILNYTQNNSIFYSSSSPLLRGFNEYIFVVLS